MKKIILSILVLLCFQVAQSQKLKPILEFTGGYNNWGSKTSAQLVVPDKNGDSYVIQSVSADWSTKNSPMYTDILIGVSLKKFSMKQRIENYFSFSPQKGNILSFSPMQINYTTGIYFNTNKIEIGYEHMCSHPVINNTVVMPDFVYRAWYDKIYFKIIIL